MAEITTMPGKQARATQILAIWDQDVTDVNGVPASEIVAAVNKARDAFWASIAETFTLVEYGDMMPGDELPFMFASNAVVMTWLAYNHPAFDMAGWRLSECCGAPLIDEDEQYLICDTCGQPSNIQREWPTRG